MASNTDINCLEPQTLLHVFSYLDAKNVARVYCTQRLWRDLVSDDLVWKQFFQQDWLAENPSGPDDKPLATYREAYCAWALSFGPEYKPYIRRALVAWKKIKAWLSGHFPAVLATLRPGASEAEVQEAGEKLGKPLHPALKAIYRLHNGQQKPGPPVEEPAAADEEDEEAEGGGGHGHVFQGLFGGYAFYDHLVCTRLFALEQLVAWTQGGRQQGVVPEDTVIFAGSFNMQKLFVADNNTATAYAACPAGKGLHRVPAHPAEATEDGVLRWFEEYANRLEGGWYEVAELFPEAPVTKAISLFPLQAPAMVSQVTRGVQVRASSIYAPEMQVATRGGHHFFAYSIRFSLLPPEQQLEHWPVTAGPPRVLRSCQLRSRHWVIRDDQGRMADEVRGDAVIGKHPLLRPGEPEFVYQSCTTQKTQEGSMEGDFAFVEGSLDDPTGPEWDVMCPRFALKIPDYIF